jgi:hypothetical protein
MYFSSATFLKGLTFHIKLFGLFSYLLNCLVSGRLPGLPQRETVCELCGGSFPQPITFHMKSCHPGCGEAAGGKGYNSGGNFCVGWAGNCGDGGIGKCISRCILD